MYVSTWASLVAQKVKNPPAVQEIWVRSLDWEDSLQESMATHSSILAWRIPMHRRAWWATIHGGCRESDTTEHKAHTVHVSTHTYIISQKLEIMFFFPLLSSENACVVSFFFLFWDGMLDFRELNDVWICFTDSIFNDII